MLKYLILILFFITWSSVNAQDSVKTISQNIIAKSGSTGDHDRPGTCIFEYNSICYAYKLKINTPLKDLIPKVDTSNFKVSPVSNNDSLIVILYDGFQNRTSSISLVKPDYIKSSYVVKDSLLKETYIIEKNTSKYISGIIVLEFKSDEPFWDFVAIKNKE